VLGHSLGGMVVLRLALRRPDAVRALVLAAGAGLSIGTSGAASCSRSYAVGPGGSPRAIARSSPAHRCCDVWFSVRLGRRPVGLTERSVEGFLAGQLLHTDVDSAWQALRRDDPRQHLEAMRCPVLVLWGAEDVQLPLDDAFEYTRRLRARLRVIPAAAIS
jgi:pimeloyl-ACP methyl ester carboxylesterase